MLTYTSPDGLDAPIPFAYAHALERDGTTSSVIATPRSLDIANAESRLTITFDDLPEPLVICTMRGQPWPEQIRQWWYSAWAGLPYSFLVAHAIEERERWMQENEGFRGIPVKENKAELRKQGARDS